MQRIAVTKCQGTGNDFVLYDARRGAARAYPELAQRLCDRRRGIGADGLLVLDAAQANGADVSMRIFNPDGSQAEMCGNGIRCVARYVWEDEPQREQLRIATLAGVIHTHLQAIAGDITVRVAMGEARFRPFPGPEAPLAALGGQEAAFELVSMGNPHLVIVTERAPSGFDLPAIARESEALWGEERTPNVEIACVQGPHSMSMRVYERGAGETWACGTGACAVAAAALRMRRITDPVMVRSRGGEVRVEWAGPGATCWLTGDAHIVFEAQVPLPDEAVSAATAL